jgi:cytochrome c-type biogenesis protein CcmH/NrfF
MPVRKGRNAMDAMLWGLTVVGGPLVLGVVLYFYGQRRRRTRAERQVSNEAARENWGKENIR